MIQLYYELPQTLLTTTTYQEITHRDFLTPKLNIPTLYTPKPVEIMPKYRISGNKYSQFLLGDWIPITLKKKRLVSPIFDLKFNFLLKCIRLV